MKQVTFIGAGSWNFTRVLVRDLLATKGFQDAKIMLMDINAERLEVSRLACEKIVKAGNYPCTVVTTTDRQKALEGSDAVIITILNGDIDVWKNDIEIPAKYGVDINVGDTRGPSGIFRFLRTAPVMLSICRDIEKICPNALVLNYTNPMAMLCRYLQGQTKVNITGLCHSVQGTAALLASWIKADMKDINYVCAGVNHQAWYLKFEHKGKDAYPALRDAITGNFNVYNAELVRNEMFLALDYYVTESSGHSSEYNQWFRKRPDLIRKYCEFGGSWNPGKSQFILNAYREREHTWKDDIKAYMDAPEDLSRSPEYASYIIDAYTNGVPFEFNGNVRNRGYIGNLPEGACVEIPVKVTKGKLTPQKVGDLPRHLAVINHISAGCEELAVEALQEGSLKKLYYAVLNDPLTGAVLSLEEIKRMTDEMVWANKEYFAEHKLFNF